MKLISARILHRYLGFFLAGIMTVYALSGIVLIYRKTDVFKVAHDIEKTLSVNLTEADLGRELKMRRFEVDSQDEHFLYFKNGSYNKASGVTKYTVYELPIILDKMAQLHKATTNSPIYWLNIFFGASLLFFALSSFWMFLPKSKTFKTGLKYSVIGAIIAITLVYMS